jgi:hypothetical protein
MRKILTVITLVSIQFTGISLVKAQSPVVPKGPLKPFSIMMEAVMQPDTGTAPPRRRLGDKFELTTWKGHQALRRESTTIAADNTTVVFWEITYSDAKTLLPYYSEWRRRDGLFIKREFDGLNIKETHTTANPFSSPRIQPGTPIDSTTISYTLTRKTYDWLGGAGLPIVMGLPLHEGLAGSIPTLSGDSTEVTQCVTGPCYVADLTYNVAGQETVTGLSGHPVKCWKVVDPGRQFTFWIACDDRHLEQVTWPGKGGLFHMEIAAR